MYPNTIKFVLLFKSTTNLIRTNFFGRGFTETSDKLPAVAGLAQMLKKRLLGVPYHKYLTDLWSTRISENRSWIVLDFDSATDFIEGIPTWGWAPTTAPTDHIYGKPSDTFVGLVEARCTGYARLKETLASLRAKDFVAPLYLRVDYRPRETSKSVSGSMKHLH